MTGTSCVLIDWRYRQYSTVGGGSKAMQSTVEQELEIKDIWDPTDFNIYDIAFFDKLIFKSVLYIYFFVYFNDFLLVYDEKCLMNLKKLRSSQLGFNVLGIPYGKSLKIGHKKSKTYLQIDPYCFHLTQWIIKCSHTKG